jgi:hypothetical protein
MIALIAILQSAWSGETSNFPNKQTREVKPPKIEMFSMFPVKMFPVKSCISQPCTNLHDGQESNLYDINRIS